MTFIHAPCTFDGKQIGYGMAHTSSEAGSDTTSGRRWKHQASETSTVAFELFDRYGCVRIEFKDHCVLKATTPGQGIGPR